MDARERAVGGNAVARGQPRDADVQRGEHGDGFVAQTAEAALKEGNGVDGRKARPGRLGC